MDFVMAATEAPKEQQFRIFDAGSQLHTLARALLPNSEEHLSALATASALAIGSELFSEDGDEKALDYLRTTVAELLPEVKKAIAEVLKKKGN